MIPDKGTPEVPVQRDEREASDDEGSHPDTDKGVEEQSGIATPLSQIENEEDSADSDSVVLVKRPTRHSKQLRSSGMVTDWLSRAERQRAIEQRLAKYPTDVGGEESVRKEEENREAGLGIKTATKRIYACKMS